MAAPDDYLLKWWHSLRLTGWRSSWLSQFICSLTRFCPSPHNAFNITASKVCLLWVPQPLNVQKPKSLEHSIHNPNCQDGCHWPFMCEHNRHTHRGLIPSCSDGVGWRSGYKPVSNLTSTLPLKHWHSHAQTHHRAVSCSTGSLHLVCKGNPKWRAGLFTAEVRQVYHLGKVTETWWIYNIRWLLECWR